MWGTVVEHELGWRAQFAYPKTLFLPPDLIPCDTKEMEARLGALAAYDIDIFMLGGGRKIPLCRKGSGFDTEGLDYLIGNRTEYYARRQRGRTLMKSDRVAIFRRGIPVIEPLFKHKCTRRCGAESWSGCAATKLCGIGRIRGGRRKSPTSTPFPQVCRVCKCRQKTETTNYSGFS
jgi:hypothetical protein